MACGLETGRIAASHGPQRDEGAQIIIGGRNEFAPGLHELGDERFRSRSSWHFAPAKDEQMTELECRIDARCGHRRFQARLEGDCVRMAQNAEAIVLLAITFRVEGEGKAAMQRGAPLIGVALNPDVDIVRKIEVLFEQPQCRVEKLIQSILAFGVHEADRRRQFQLSLEGVIEGIWFGSWCVWTRNRCAKHYAFGDLRLGDAKFTMCLARFQKLAWRVINRGLERDWRERPSGIWRFKVVCRVGWLKPCGYEPLCYIASRQCTQVRWNVIAIGHCDGRPVLQDLPGCFKA
jgi:hypothetical protein